MPIRNAALKIARLGDEALPFLEREVGVFAVRVALALLLVAPACRWTPWRLRLDFEGTTHRALAALAGGGLSCQGRDRPWLLERGVDFSSRKSHRAPLLPRLPPVLCC